MTVKGGTSQACAACKYQRRRCTPDCALAPYFPADKPKMFQNAHRLFGVCNIMKILKQLRDDQKEEAMRSIIYEADMRERFPVFGCSLVIFQLKEQLRQFQEELFYVDSLLVTFRNNNKENSQSQNLISDPQFQLGFVPCNDVNVMSQNNNYYATNSHIMNGGMGFASNSNQVFSGDKNLNLGYVAEWSDNIGVGSKALWMPQNNIGSYYGTSLSGNDNLNSFGMKPQFVATQGMPADRDQHEIDVSHDYDDMPFDIADDGQSYIESKEACESSVESPMKGSMQSIINAVSQNHELKSAAACFSLTSVN